MVVKLNKVQRTSRKPWIIVGVLSFLVLIGVGGCGASQSTSLQSPTRGQSSQGQTVQGQTYQGQQNQGQRSRNPVMQVAAEISRLQRDQQNALTNDQKNKIKPILQELINTANPSQDILQQKADAINAVLTEQQKGYLAAQRNPQGNNQNKNNPNGNNPNRNNQQGGPRGGPGANNQTGPSNPQDLYQRLLDSLK